MVMEIKEVLEVKTAAKTALQLHNTNGNTYELYLDREVTIKRLSTHLALAIIPIN